MGIFDDLNFAFVGINGGEKSKLVELIEEEGGTIHKSVKKDTNYLISTEKSVGENGATVKSAFDKNIKVVSADFVNQSSEQEKLLDSSSFELKASKKRKAEEEEEEEDEEEEEEEEKEEKETEEPAAKKKKIVSTGKVPVDEESGMQTTGKIHVDGSNVWSATLNQTNIGNNNNKFYIIQLIESGSSYYVFNRWGRVSAKGQSKLSKMGGLQKAKDDFMKKFKDKTGNEWSKRSTFKFKKGKYDWVDIDYSEDDPAEEDEKDDESKEEKKKVESKLDKRVQDLVKFISDKSFIDQTMREFEIDTNKMPLGKLSKKQIQGGYEILKKIQDVIDGKNDDDDLESLSSRFYTIIPHQFGHRQVPPIIRTKTQLETKIALVESLGEIEIASKIISKKTDQNIVDSIYGDLKTDLTPIDKESDEWKWINKFIQNTHAPTHSYYTLELEDAFVVKRHGEVETYVAKSEGISNKQLLFHGSRSTNFVGILSQGLRIAPPEAPATGYMFGKGVYFADMCSKSANYCHAHLSDNSGLLLLTEVALGNTYNRTQAEFVTKLPKGLHSCWGQGGTEPDNNEFLEIDSSCNGQKVKVPYGQPTSVTRSGALLYNEFIVYDTAQANLRYLIKCKFNNKKH